MIKSINRTILLKYVLLSIPFAIFIISLIFRTYGIWNNYPYWIDEFSTGNQALLLIKYGLRGVFDSSLGIDHNNITTNILVAIIFKLLGNSQEWFSRIPFVIIGSFVPVVIFLLAKKLHNTSVAVSASMLATFSYFEILWSRQARGYVLQQLLILFATYLYFTLIDKNDNKQRLFKTMAFLAIIFLGILTHKMFYIYIISMAIHYLLTNRNYLAKILKDIKIYVFFGIVLIILFATSSFQALNIFFNSTLLGANNIWYYHSFLWRQYSLLSFFCILGLVLGLSTKSKTIFKYYAIYFFFHLIFINFVFAHYMSKYLLPIFPFIFIVAGYSIYSISKLIVERYSLFNKGTFTIAIATITTLFIIANGNKFVIKPKAYYSLNHEVREISNVDYHSVYGLIKTRIQGTEEQIAVIDTWPDRTYWYLGRNIQPFYLFRWQNDLGVANGHEKSTHYWVNSSNEKMVSSDLRFVGEVDDLVKAMNKYKKGFLLVDDSTMPIDVIQFANDNLFKELYIDHYPLDDNPYSIWPTTLYSWGFEDTTEPVLQ